MLDKIDIQILQEIAVRAGKAILEIYEQPFEIETKADKSPLTAADKASNDIIIAGLEKHYASIPIISEENKQLDYDTRKNWEYCWMVDPLDGTKEFIKKNGEFTVNIALIHKNESVLGVVYVPVKDTLYYAIKGQGAFKISNGGSPEKIHAKAAKAGEIVRIFASRSHLNADTQAFIDQCKEKFADVELVAAGSSLKFCLLAEGIAHIYPRFAPTMEWDTAAAHIVATESGASVTIPENGEALNYNKENLLNPYFLVQV